MVEVRWVSWSQRARYRVLDSSLGPGSHYQRARVNSQGLGGLSVRTIDGSAQGIAGHTTSDGGVVEGGNDCFLGKMACSGRARDEGNGGEQGSGLSSRVLPLLFPAAHWSICSATHGQFRSLPIVRKVPTV